MPILDSISTKSPEGLDKDKAKKELKDISKKIGEQLEMMAAEGKHSLLVVFQGMDSSGKDGSTAAVFERSSPSYVKTKIFKKPTDEEFAHDFLWRATPHAPRKGQASVFIRSHYEDVLIQRVHKWVTEEHVQKRIDAINAWEELIGFDNNTTVLKFYLHLSHEKQGEKLQERIDVADKNWKHNPGDWEERKHWDKYMDCYEDLFVKCSVPWIIAPADQRWYRNYFIAKKVLETLEGFNMKWPEPEA